MQLHIRALKLNGIIQKEQGEKMSVALKAIPGEVPLRLLGT